MVEFLAKIQRREHIIDMYEHEYLYFSVFNEFRKDNIDSAGRFDPREGNLKNTQLRYIRIQTQEGRVLEFTKEKNRLNAQVMEHLAEPQMNICSLIRLKFKIDDVLQPLDARIKELGDSAMIIGDKETFFDNLDEALNSGDYEYSRGVVTYYDPRSHDGDLSLLHKDVRYEWQQEYRILIGPLGVIGVKIYLPGLKKICLLCQTSSINKLLFRRNDGAGNTLGFKL